MTTPYQPVQFEVPVLNPALGSVGAPALPYLSVSEYNFAPTGVSSTNLVTGNVPVQQTQALADTIARVSSWMNEYCFGVDPASEGASLAASLSVEGCYVKAKPGGRLALICDYKPILEVTGVDVGCNPASLASVGASAAQGISIGRRTIYVPYCGVPTRSGDSPPAFFPSFGLFGLYATWSYVAGYPHTELVDDVAAEATSCVVAATNGTGGLWGVYPASGTFLGTRLTIRDQGYTEAVYVQAVAAGTPSADTATLTTTPFANAHQVPDAPDFLPVTALPNVVQQAAISATSLLIKTRGARGFVMPQTPGEAPNRQALAEAGAMSDWRIVEKILRRFAVRVKSKV